MSKKKEVVLRLDTNEKDDQSPLSLYFEESRPIENITMNSHPNSKNLNSMGNNTIITH